MHGLDKGYRHRNASLIPFPNVANCSGEHSVKEIKSEAHPFRPVVQFLVFRISEYRRSCIVFTMFCHDVEGELRA